MSRTRADVHSGQNGLTQPNCWQFVPELKLADGEPVVHYWENHTAPGRTAGVGKTGNAFKPAG